jgi:biopolymer transport protein ExbB
MVLTSTSPVRSALAALAVASALLVPALAAAQASAPAATTSVDAAAASAAAPAPIVTAPAATTETVDNPYGLKALWEQGDFVSKGTLIILVLMSMGSWYILITKLYESFKLSSEAKS